MNFRLSIGWLISLVLLVGCGDPSSTPTAEDGGKSPAHVRADLELKGATAEDLKQIVETLSPWMQLAVIEDGKAALYFDGGLERVKKVIDIFRQTKPDDLKILALESGDGNIPEAPSTEKRKIVRWLLKNEELAARGITSLEAARQIRAFGIPLDAELDADTIKGKTLAAPDGKTIPLEEVASVSLEEVSRPLIIKGREGAATDR